jgi:hypothetical protein
MARKNINHALMVVKCFPCPAIWFIGSTFYQKQKQDFDRRKHNNKVLNFEPQKKSEAFCKTHGQPHRPSIVPLPDWQSGMAKTTRKDP